MQTTHRTRGVLARVLITLAVLGTGVGAVGTVAFCEVFGCSLSPEPFEPDGDRAQAQRLTTRAELDAVLDAATGSAPVLGEAWVDVCVEGHDGWKRKDSYAHECTLELSRIVVVTTQPAVGPGLSAADEAARAAGCRPLWPAGGLEEVRRRHWEAWPPEGAGTGATALPHASYSCRGSVFLRLRPTASDEDPDLLGPARLVLARAGEGFAPADLRRLRGSGATLALVATAEDAYYTTSF